MKKWFDDDQEFFLVILFVAMLIVFCGTLLIIWDM